MLQESPYGGGNLQTAAAGGVPESPGAGAASSVQGLHAPDRSTRLRGPGFRRADAGDYAAFLARFPLDRFATFTYRDEYIWPDGDKSRRPTHPVFSHVSALNDLGRFFRDLDYYGQYAAFAEDHFERDVPHLHVLLENCGRDDLWTRWFDTRGRNSIEPIRGKGEAVRIYAGKYAAKETSPESCEYVLREPYDLSRCRNHGRT